MTVLAKSEQGSQGLLSNYYPFVIFIEPSQYTGFLHFLELMVFAVLVFQVDLVTPTFLSGIYSDSPCKCIILTNVDILENIPSGWLYMH